MASKNFVGFHVDECVIHVCGYMRMSLCMCMDSSEYQWMNQRRKERERDHLNNVPRAQWLWSGIFHCAESIFTRMYVYANIQYKSNHCNRRCLCRISTARFRFSHWIQLFVALILVIVCVCMRFVYRTFNNDWSNMEAQIFESTNNYCSYIEPSQQLCDPQCSMFLIFSYFDCIYCINHCLPYIIEYCIKGDPFER